MTKSVFARLVEVPLSTISRIESGKVDPTWAMLQKIIQRAGFAFDGALRDAGDDAVVARTVGKLRVGAAKVTVRDLPQTANAAKVMRRTGAKTFALDGSISDLLAQLKGLGQQPIVSALEAFAGDATTTRSFTPVVYVNDPEALNTVLPKRSASAATNVVILPTTKNVTSNAVTQNGVQMVDREWALVDALASPGRQPEVALGLIAAL